MAAQQAHDILSGGKKTMTRISKKSKKTNFKNSMQRLEQILLERIQAGVYPMGSTLPKISQFVEEFRVSRDTVCKTLQTLEKKGVTQKLGRQYVAGTLSHFLQPSTVNREKYVLIVQCEPGAFQNLLVNKWTAAFGNTFLREMSWNSYQPIPIHASHASLSPLDKNVPAGRKDIISMVEKLRDKLAGFLVIGIAWDFAQKGGENLDDLISWLCSFSKPVIWFDAMDAGGHYQNEFGVVNKMHKICRKPHVARYFTRFHLDELAACKLALEVLQKRGGIKNIAIPLLPVWRTKKWSWQNQRLDLLRKAALDMGFDVTFHVKNIPSELSQFDWKNFSLPRLIKVLNNHEHLQPLLKDAKELFSGADSRLGNKKKEKMLFMVGAFANIFSSSEIDCIMALNDEASNFFCRWCEWKGFDLLAKKTIISFDGDLEKLYPFRVSSVDFGFDSLAHRAFHQIAGSFSESRGKKNSVASIPRVTQMYTILSKQ